ncbi:hypothetical protein ACVWYQ_002419 [Bradyrhizobium sp. USDA 3397]
MDGPRLGSASSNRTMLRIAGGTLRCVRGTRECSARTLLLVVARSPCDEAIQNPAAERFWIASAFAKGFGGQVAALAMTECEATLRSPSNTCRSLRRQGIQHAAPPRFNHWRLGVLDRPPSRAMTASVEVQTCLRILAADFARALLGHFTLFSKRAQGRPGAGGTRGPLREKHTQEEPHSSIQVKPNTRPSLRDGRTAYAALSWEPSSLWPPSLSQKSPAPRRLTRGPHSPELDRSNDGQDHTVLPYARFVGAAGFEGVVHVAIEKPARRT